MLSIWQVFVFLFIYFLQSVSDSFAVHCSFLWSNHSFILFHHTLTGEVNIEDAVLQATAGATEDMVLPVPHFDGISWWKGG